MKTVGLLVCLLAAWPLGASADRASATMPVSVMVVRPALRLVTLSAPTHITLNEADVERGHVMVSLRYELRGTRAPGQTLRIDPRLGMTESIVLQGLATEVTVQDQPVEISLPAGTTDQPLDLTLLWQLSANATPGAYPLPLRLSLPANGLSL